MITGVEKMQNDTGKLRNVIGKLGGAVRALLLCLVLAFAVTAVDVAVDPAIAEAAIKKSECSALNQPACPVRYKGPICDRGLGKINGLCRKCSGEGQYACPKSVKGKPCAGGRMKIDGRCYKYCGGANQKACAKAKKGYPCRGSYEPDSKGFCKPCGAAGQKQCRALKAGKQCNPGTVKYRGKCKACGARGQQACPKLASGYPCKGQNEPNSSGICSACGGDRQKACRALKAGKQCNTGTRKLQGSCYACGANGQVPCPGLAKGKRCNTGTKQIGLKCTTCGGANQRACPKLATGFPCRGDYRPDGNNICKPCGGVGEPSCRVLKAGRQCAEWSTSRRGSCVPCGDRNQNACRITDKGKPCKPGLTRKLNGTCKMTKVGMVRQAMLKQLSKDSAALVPMLQKGSDLSQDDSMRRNLSDGAESFSDDESRATRAAARTPTLNSDNIAGDRGTPRCPAGTNTWAVGVGVEAGLFVNVEGEAGMAFNCSGNRAGQKDAKWYFSRSLNFRLGGGAAGGFTLSFWKDDVSDLRGKSHGYVIDVVEMIENLTGISKDVKALMTGDITKIKKALGSVAPEITIGAWFARRNEDGAGLGWIKENDVGRFLGYTITFSAGAGWDAGGAHILATTEQICTIGMKCTEGTWTGKIGSRNGTIYVDGQTTGKIEVSLNGANPLTYTRETTTGRKYHTTLGGEIRFRKNYTELQYRSGGSGRWSKLQRSEAQTPTLAGIFTATVDGTKHTMVIDNVRNKGFHAIFDRGARTRFDKKKFKSRTYEGGYQNVIRYRENYRKLFYKPLGGDEILMTRGDASDIDAGNGRFHLAGEWGMRVNGRELIEIMTFLPSGTLSVTREGSDAARFYQNSGVNEYTNQFGGKFRFVTGARGIWVSADGNTVFQLRKK